MKTSNKRPIWLFALPLCATWFVQSGIVSNASAQDVPTVGQDIAYASGGIGVSQREALQAIVGDYSLKLEFAAESTGAYVTGVTVSVLTAEKTVFRVENVGPWLLVKLPVGSYRVVAESGGESRDATVEVTDNGLTDAVLRFPEP
ncbi:MAG: hypothetical protein WBG92_08890 [Thiohalocapsa sp.]